MINLGEAFLVFFVDFEKLQIPFVFSGFRPVDGFNPDTFFHGAPGVVENSGTHPAD